MILNFLAGSVTGALFKVHALFLLLGLVLLEFMIFAAAHSGITWESTALSLVDVQIGYLSGILGRVIIEALTGQKIAEAESREHPARRVE